MKMLKIPLDADFCHICVLCAAEIESGFEWKTIGNMRCSAMQLEMHQQWKAVALWQCCCCCCCCYCCWCSTASTATAAAASTAAAAAAGFTAAAATAHSQVFAQYTFAAHCPVPCYTI